MSTRRPVDFANPMTWPNAGQQQRSRSDREAEQQRRCAAALASTIPPATAPLYPAGAKVRVLGGYEPGRPAAALALGESFRGQHSAKNDAAPLLPEVTAAAAQHGLTLRAAAALDFVHRATRGLGGQASQIRDADVGKAIGGDHAAGAKMVDGLARLGLVEKQFPIGAQRRIRSLLGAQR